MGHAEVRAEMHTFLVADLAGYSALTELHGDEHAAQVAAEFFSTVRALLPRFGAEEVKAMGDALLVRVPTVTAAARLARLVVCDRRHQSLGVRAGIHQGTAVRRDGDWFGQAVNVAARVADLARGGEVLVSEAARRSLGPAIPARPQGRHELKNILEPIPIYALVLETPGAGSAFAVDPVCQMTVDPALAPERRERAGRSYVFCSERCAATFDGAPARFSR